MNRSLVIAIAAGLLLMPIVVYAQSEERPSQAPPLAQPLVREGDFAIKLVDRLKIGTAQNEAEAESMLASNGIAPRNGWIADYPVTPDIIGELVNSVTDAAQSGRLTMAAEEATKAFQDLTTEVGLPVIADTRDESAGDVQASNYGQYSDPGVINDYYYNEGPPVVTYYPPPWDYYYMYAWVPSPFWCSGFFFPGFFILHDFHRVIIIHKRPIIITNHYRDPRTKRVHTIDPVERLHGRNFREGERARPRGLIPPRRKAVPCQSTSGTASACRGQKEGPSTGIEALQGCEAGPKSRPWITAREDPRPSTVVVAIRQGHRLLTAG